jgi:hypothetical protein
MSRTAVLAVALAGLVAGAARADDALAGRYRLDATSGRDGRWVSGEVVLGPDPERAFTRTIGGVTQRGRWVPMGDGAFDIEFAAASGLAGALQGPATATARGRYWPDGHGGLAGEVEGAHGRLHEALTPLAAPGSAAAAREAAALAALTSRRLGPGDAGAVVRLAREARASGLVDARRFVDALRTARRLTAALDAAAPDDRRALAAIVREVTPPGPEERENAAFERALAAYPRARLEAHAYPLIVVTGFTPTSAERLHELTRRARRRCERAAADFHAGRAPFLLTTGGAVHPEGTPVIEALELKAELVRLGVPAERIAVEPHARHSTTNLRNAARFMLARGLSRALVVTSFDQSFYFSRPRLSTFHRRARKELGYEVGRLVLVDAYRSAFWPSERCLEEGDDPLDP